MRSSLARRKSSPKKQNHTKTTVDTIAQAGISRVVRDMSVNVHRTPPTGWLPEGVTTRSLVQTMSPMVTSGMAGVEPYDTRSDMGRP